MNRREVLKGAVLATALGHDTSTDGMHLSDKGAAQLLREMRAEYAALNAVMEEERQAHRDR